jgi:hypothetical protein
MNQADEDRVAKLSAQFPRRRCIRGWNANVRTALAAMNGGESVLVVFATAAAARRFVEDVITAAVVPPHHRSQNAAQWFVDGKFVRLSAAYTIGGAEAHTTGLDTRKWQFLDARHETGPRNERNETMDRGPIEQLRPLDVQVAEMITNAGGDGFALDLLNQLDEQSTGKLRDALLQFTSRLDRMPADRAALGESPTVEDLDTLLQELIGHATVLADDATQVVDGSAGRRTIEVRRAMNPPDEWRPPVDLRRHEALDLRSLADMALTMGDAEGGVATYVGDRRVVAVLNEWRDEGDGEIVQLQLQRSKVFRDLSSIADGSQVMSQRELDQWLILNQRHLADPSWIQEVRQLSASTKVDTESGIQRGERKQSISVVTSAGPGVVKLPEQFRMQVPILVLDDDGEPAANWANVDVLLLVDLPKHGDEGTGFRFRLAAINLEAHERARLAAVVDETHKAFQDARVGLRDADERWRPSAEIPVQILRGEANRVAPTIGFERWEQESSNAADC